MVRKHFCDRCGKDIDIQSNDFDDMFKSVSSEFGEESLVTQPELCGKCLKGYKKIIAETNKKITDYIRRE